MNGILGKKLGMTRIVEENGNYVPVTLIDCAPNVIHQLKTDEKDGYNAIVLGFAPRKRPSKTKKFYYVREIKTDSLDECKKGANVTVTEVFEKGDKITITGITKGKGFQGTMKKWNFHGGPEGHGSHHHREPGSVGACAAPGKIVRGMKMATRMGNEQQTLRSYVILIDAEKHLIGIKGPVPGSINSFVTIKKL